MTTIDLFKPGKRKALFKQVQFPATWNDLEPPELLAITRFFLHPDPQTQQVSKARLFLSLLEYRVKKSKLNLPKGWQALLDPEDAAIQAINAIQFIFDGNTLTRLPEKKIGFGFTSGVSVYGPADDFNDITCGEYEDAGVFADKFQRDPKLDDLMMLVAVLYHQKQGNDRRPYHLHKPEAYLKHLKQISPERLYLVYIWFVGCCGPLPALFPDVYAGAAGGGEGDPTAFTRCIHAGAGPKNGTREQVRKLPLKEFLFDMQLEARKAKDELAAMQKMT